MTNTNNTNINHRLVKINRMKNDLTVINRKNNQDLQYYRTYKHKTMLYHKQHRNEKESKVSYSNVNQSNVDQSNINRNNVRNSTTKPYSVRYTKRKNISTTNGVSTIRVYFMIWFFVMIIINITYQKLEIHMVADRIIKEGIDYDSFRDMKISKGAINKVKVVLNKENNNENNNENKKKNIVNRLTLTMMTNEFKIDNSKLLSQNNTKQMYKLLSNNASVKELNKYYYAIMNDIKCFPVQNLENGKPCVTFTDTWNAYRSYGGVRRHEGTDLMAIDNVRGRYKVLSMTDGVVEKMGWLEQGGYRIGIRGDSGAYFYYAHLDSYAQNLKQGDIVKAGDFLGYMGDSGYGKEGTTGKFDVHLHMGIYVDAPFGEMSINPYSILLYLQSR